MDPYQGYEVASNKDSLVSEKYYAERVPPHLDVCDIASRKRGKRLINAIRDFANSPYASPPDAIAVRKCAIPLGNFA